MKYFALITISLLLTTKFMLFSVTQITPFCILLSNIINIILIVYNLNRINRVVNYKLYLLLIISFSLVIVNIAKLNDSIGIKDILYPTDLHILLSLIVALLISSDILKKALNLYLNIIAIIISIGLVLYVFNYAGIVKPNGIVHAVDHANPAGYSSLYSLAYYPSWINLPLGLKRFTSIYWEPGTLGLYLIFYIISGRILKDGNGKNYREYIFVLAGVFSFSLLFYLLYALLVFIDMRSLRNRIYLVLFSIIIFILTYNLLYELIWYRLSYDPSRGFVGNNRSGIISYYIGVLNTSPLVNALFGFGLEKEFMADSTSIVTKFFQRGIIGALLLFIPYITLGYKSNYKLYFMIMILGLCILAQIEGALTPIFFFSAVIGLKKIDRK